MTKKSFKDWLSFRCRKFVISLKRNYYVIPLIFVFLCCVQFLCCLYVFSPVFDRIPQKFGEYNCLFVFVISLLTILYSVAYLNYALIKYGQKRPIFMLILYFVMWAVVIVLLFVIFKANSLNLAEEYADYEAATSESKKNEYLTYINLGTQCQNMLLTNIVFEFISVVLVITAPFVQKAFRKIRFKPIDEYGKEKQEEQQE
ncbi:MAG: hypothetical protein ACI311_05845 [Bacilli bacterium]